MNEYAPLFEMNNDIVMHNLHLGAVEEAASVCRVEEPMRDILNSYDDGDHFTVSPNKQGEIGIIKKFEDFNGMDSLASAKATKRLKASIFAGLKAYVKYFADQAQSDALTLDDLEIFVPDQYGIRTKSSSKKEGKSTKLEPMPAADFKKFISDHPDEKPVVGYKITFSIG